MVPAITAGGVAVIGVGVIVGWIFEIEPLMTVVPGLIRMKPNTAVAFLFAATALYLADKRKCRLLQGVCAGFVFLMGVVTMAEYVAGFNIGIDQIAFRDPVQFPFPGRMAQFTAGAFALIGIVLYPFHFRGKERLTDALALAVGYGSTFAVVGYLYGVPILYGSTNYTAMAVHTGIAFLLLSTGFLCIEKNQGFGNIFRAQSPGGLVARRLVPLAIMVPIVVGALFNRFNFGQLRLGITFIVLSNILLIVAAIWGLAHVLHKSELERGSAQQASEIDGLTGIHNRRFFDQNLAQEIQRCVRHSRASCLIMFDIDHFKNLNDEFGHQCGDTVLKTVAEACKRSLRTTDVFCRFGGEEFAVIAPETHGCDGMVLADKLRNLVAELSFAEIPVQVTISLGVAQIGRAMATTEGAIAAADKALYASKKLGRNRESLFDEVAEQGVERMAEQVSEVSGGN